MALVDEMGARLTAQGVCSTAAGSTGWMLRYRALTPIPVRQVVVTPSGGLPQEGKAPVDRPAFQVMIRGSSDDGGSLEAKVDAVIAALNLFDGTLTGLYSAVPRVYVDVQKQGDTLFLGLDDNQRPIYSVNFVATRSRTT